MPGVGISIVIFAIGAILDFAITVNPEQHGVNLNTIGLILMIVGAVGFVLSLLVWATGGFGGWPRTHRHTTVVEDGRPTVADDGRTTTRRSEDVYR
ncbi:MAG: hypothetical protein J2O39_01015 [Acidimicrobiales bacterium]|nr:hypothetical protein [Acidimicrobiales bacterium]MBO0892929.1 hypothetical protein [Acidimicrobiales bacterium]